jgi:hypothetical protein
LDAFVQHVKSNSNAVMNISAQLLDDFLSGDNTLMSNYVLQTNSQTRKSAKRDDDRQRRATEGLLFGVYGEQIRYAALSLEQKGLHSYGRCCIALADVTMQHFATVMEENSYDFVANHRILPQDNIPLGYRASWTDRHLLATAKLAAKITANEQDLSELLLSCDGNRDNDKFMEVHIYGAFDNQSIVKISIPGKTKDRKEKMAFAGIENYASQKKLSCEKR